MQRTMMIAAAATAALAAVLAACTVAPGGPTNGMAIGAYGRPTDGREPFYRGDGGCSMAGAVAMEVVFRECALGGVALDPGQEQAIRPHVLRLSDEIMTTYHTDPRPTWERFWQSVRPILRPDQAGRARANIDDALTIKTPGRVYQR